MSTPEPQIDVAHGDIGLSRFLQDTLKVLASNTKDADLQRQIEEISAGRASLHSLMQCGAFTQIIDQALPAAGQEAAARSDDELHRLAEAGEAILESYRNEDLDTPPNTEQSSESASQKPLDHTLEAPQADDPGPTRNAIPGTRKPNRDQIVSPDELDEDDLYFQERRQRGWLE